MAQRRMLNIDLILDDHFTQDLSPEAQNMYVYLSVLADDDGIVNHLKRKLRMINKEITTVDELVKKDYLFKYNDQTVIIIDWLISNHIKADRYTPSREDDCRSSLFITYDWRYSLDKNDKKVFSSYVGWLTNKRRVNGQRFDQVSREELKQIAKQMHEKKDWNNYDTNMEHNRNNHDTPVSVSVAVPVSVAGKGAGAVIGKGKGKELGKDIKYIHSSSNGGMGEDASLTTTTSTSTKDNNATREIKPSTPNSEKQSNKQSDNQEAVNSLLNYINAVANTNIPTDDKRLLDVLNKLITNGYEVEDVESGIDNVVDTVKQMPQYNTPQALSRLLVQHLADYTRTALEKNNNE